MKALFRVNAGARIGLGHLQRCLSLAAALRQLGTASLVLTDQEPSALERIRRFGFPGLARRANGSWGEEDARDTIDCARAHQCDILVVDSDEKGAAYLQRLREAGLFVCAIDDTAPHPFPCQLVVNGDAHARRLAYRSSSGDTRFLLGPEYAILREEFWALPPRVAPQDGRRLLIALGGADPVNLMPRILDVVGRWLEPVTVTAIVGPFMTNLAETRAAARRVAHPVRLVQAPESVAGLMQEADVAISAGGQTLYELARVGCPTVAVRIAANQDGQLQAFQEAGFLRLAGRAEDPGIASALGEAARRLLADSPAREAMGEIGRRMVDGQGARRVADGLLQHARVSCTEAPVSR